MRSFCQMESSFIRLREGREVGLGAGRCRLYLSEKRSCLGVKGEKNCLKRTRLSRLRMMKISRQEC